MGNSRGVLAVAALLVLMVFSTPLQAHEQQTLTVIMNDEGVVSGNITDPAFVQGNAIWFRMFDDTNNTTMTVRLDIDRDGVFNASNDFDSGELVRECELDENGSLVDDSCAVSSLYAFDFNATVGSYQFWVHRNHNGTETVWNHSIMVHKDVHEEDGPSPGDCFGIGCIDENTADEEVVATTESDNSTVVLLAVISLVGMVALTLSIAKEQRERTEEKAYLEEE
ncbi:MAG: hypothetical protein DWC10_00650 [Candidatus Poseidoniales archaeon]|nr:MAG: hypothetical protein DWC10_00650 [Candidatus Poseidoniales archaeon]